MSDTARNLLIGAGMLLVALAAYTGARYWQAGTVSYQRIAPDRNCDLRQGPCRRFDVAAHFQPRLVGAEEALQAGLVNEVCEDCDAVMARAFELAEQLKTHAPLTMRSIKTLLRRIRESRSPVEDHDIIAEVYTSADFKEGMDAFLNKRKPGWLET